MLGCNGDWIEFCKRGVLHGGDNDSTGAIGGAFFGAYYGFKGVPKNHFQDMEYRERILKLADKLWATRDK